MMMDRPYGSNSKINNVYAYEHTPYYGLITDIKIMKLRKNLSFVNCDANDELLHTSGCGVIYQIWHEHALRVAQLAIYL